ncbi:MAG: quinol monooxygenase YgiN [Acidimicrobiales bacterium]|jgi:quinol monooxygenase YgiN
MATILAHLTIKPGCEARFEQIATELHDGTIRNETKVQRYEYWRGEAPRTYYTLLSFDDHQAFIEHQVSDHHEDASPQLGEVCESIRLEWVDPIQSASPLPPTNAQPAPAGADDLTLKYTNSYAARVADWWLAQR